jgi:hypothetical protein
MVLASLPLVPLLRELPRVEGVKALYLFGLQETAEEITMTATVMGKCTPLGSLSIVI